MLRAAGAAQEPQVGRNRVQCAAAGRDVSVLVLLLCSQAGPQESLWCFFCSWYSFIFCWKYAVEEKRSWCVEWETQGCTAPVLDYGHPERTQGKCGNEVSKADWMELGAMWGSGKCPCPGHGTRCPLKVPLPSNFLEFWDYVSL